MSKLPSGWVSAGLLEVSDLLRGVTYTKSDARDLAFTSSIPVLRATNIVDRGFDLSALVHVPDHIVSEAQRIKRGDVVVATSSGSISVVGKGAQAQTDMRIGFGAFCGLLRPSEEIDPRFFGHYFTSEQYRASVSRMARGVNINNLKRDHFASLTFPMPPLPEQRRISAKLDGLLARIDSCREHLTRVPAILGRFRRAVLAAATSGELTRDWRSAQGASMRPWRDAATDATLPPGYRRLAKQRFKLVHIEHEAGSLPPTWSVLSIGQLYDCSVLLDFADGNHGSLYPRKADFLESQTTTGGVSFLTATQMGDSWELDLDACPRLCSTKAAQLKKGWAQNGDVLLSHNATVGRVALLEGSAKDVLLGTSVTFYRFNPAFIEPGFARIVFSSPFFQSQLGSVMAQTTRDQVPITKQISLHVICPPIEEQREIVKRVAGLLTSAVQMLSQQSAASELVQRLRPSVLAKAFRGDIVPQDSTDEPASVLLARIRAQRERRTAASQPKPSRGSQRNDRPIQYEKGKHARVRRKRLGS